MITCIFLVFHDFWVFDEDWKVRAKIWRVLTVCSASEVLQMRFWFEINVRENNFTILSVRYAKKYKTSQHCMPTGMNPYADGERSVVVLWNQFTRKWSSYHHALQHILPGCFHDFKLRYRFSRTLISTFIFVLPVVRISSW